MSERLTHTLRYVSAAGDGESRWIRLEQERTDETVSVDEAAELIDALYQVDACAKAATGSAASGGEVIDPPPQEDYDAIAPGFLGDLCDPEYWIAHVRILRSHQEPDYTLRSASAEILAVVRDIRETARDVFDNAGNSVDLSMPYAGGLVLPPGLRGSVRGSTLNLERPVGRLAVRYQTIYDRATLRVPVSKDAATGDGEEAARRAALDAAGLIAFQGDGATALAAAVALQPPPQDEETEAAELADMCRGKDKGKPSGGGCWERLAHYKLCSCSGAPAPDSEWEETAGAACPDGVQAGKYLGVRRVLDGYVGCPGEEDRDLPDREYYKQTCCKYPPDFKTLPTCRTRYEPYRGGAPIEGGADSWRERYGPDVTFTAVAPEDGICGQAVTRWRVERQNCCDDVIPLSPAPDNPTTIMVGQVYTIGVRDGREGALEWELSGGLVFLDGTTRRKFGGRAEQVTTGPGVCPQPRVRVDDGCAPLLMTFEGEASSDPSISPQTVYGGDETEFSVTAGGGVPPYMWTLGGGLKLLGYSPDGSTVYVRTPPWREWCFETITATDQCGRVAKCNVYNTVAGTWQRVPNAEFDRCSPPGAPFPTDHSSLTPSPKQTTRPNGGYYAVINHQSGGGTSYEGKTLCDREPTYGTYCGLGNLVADTWYIQRQCKDRERVSATCCVYKQNKLTWYTNSYSQYVLELYKWYCGGTQ